MRFRDWRHYTEGCHRETCNTETKRERERERARNRDRGRDRDKDRGKERDRTETECSKRLLRMTSMLSSKRNCVSRLPYFQCVSPFPETMLESPLSRVELCIRKPVSKPGRKGKRKTEPQERNRLGHAAPAFGAHGHSAYRIRHTRSNASGQVASAVWDTLTLGRAAGARGRTEKPEMGRFQLPAVFSR